jgi:protein-disulfide isomerase
MPGVAEYEVAGGADELTTYEETPVGFTAGGHPFRGSPDAPVILVEYSDYLCPYCARHFQQTLPVLLEDYVKTGQVLLVFRDFPIAGLHPTAAQGAEAALCVAEQGPVLFWKMHDALFSRQSEWNRLPEPAEFLAGVSAEVGADPDAYAACIAAGEKTAAIEASVGLAQRLGFNGTPSFQFLRREDRASYTLVGAQPASRFLDWADALLAGEAPPQPKPPELPLWAQADGVAPDPDRPGYTKAGDAYKGNPEASLIVVEFSDFQCPACGRHALEAQPAVDEELVTPGKVLWVFKHLPLRIYPNAAAAAAAAECAGDQGRFWDMYHLLFERQSEWSEAAPDDALPALAAELGLDEAAFAGCFDSRQAMQRVLDDLYDAKGVASTTPTFVFVYGGRGGIIRGARSPEDFLRIVRRMHEAAESAPGEAPAEAEAEQ